MSYSSNVIKLKELLKEGWRIRSHHFSYKKEPAEEKVQIVLEKGAKITFIEAVNDGDFTEYAFHFQRFQDRNGNYEFIYVDDVQAYWQQIEEVMKKGVVPK